MLWQRFRNVGILKKKHNWDMKCFPVYFSTGKIFTTLQFLLTETERTKSKEGDTRFHHISSDITSIGKECELMNAFQPVRCIPRNSIRCCWFVFKTTSPARLSPAGFLKTRGLDCKEDLVTSAQILSSFWQRRCHFPAGKL